MATGMLIACAALVIEPLLRGRGRPGRTVWVGAMSLSVLLPLFALLRPEPTLMADVAAPVGSVFSSPLFVDLMASTGAPAALLGRTEPYLLATWLVASALLFVGLIGGLVRLRVRARRWPAARIADDEVLVSNDFGPAVMGLWAPRVVVPSWALGLEPAQLRMIVAHEREHGLAGDTRLLLAGALTVALAPWNPAAWWLMRRLRAAIELDCDARVLRSGAPAAEYGALLLKLSPRARGLPMAVAAFAKPQSLLERRLTMIVHGSKRGGPLKASVAMIAATLLLVAACETPAPTAALPDAGDLVAEVIQAAPPGQVRLLGENGTSPLVYVDGVRIEGLPSDLDPDAISRIEVVKGEAARALFGEEAAVGVIQIFTVAEEVEAGGSYIARQLPEAGGSVIRVRPLEAGGSYITADTSLQIAYSAERKFFVDGELVDRDYLESIDPEDILRVEVAKGEAGDAVHITLKERG